MIDDKTSVHQETIDWFQQLTFSKISRSLHGQTLEPFTALCKMIWKLWTFSSQRFFESFSQSYVTKLPGLSGLFFDPLMQRQRFKAHDYHAATTVRGIWCIKAILTNISQSS